MNEFHYSIPLFILYISETRNWKLDLNRDSTLETKTHNGKKRSPRTNTHCSEVKNYYLHGDSRITIVITDNKAFKTSDTLQWTSKWFYIVKHIVKTSVVIVHINNTVHDADNHRQPYKKWVILI